MIKLQNKYYTQTKSEARTVAVAHIFNPSTGTLKPQSNRPLCSNMVIDTLAAAK